MPPRRKKTEASQDVPHEEMKNTKIKKAIQGRRRSESFKVPKVTGTEFGELNVVDKRRVQQLEEVMLRVCIAEGMTRDEIIKHMEITSNHYDVIEKRLFSDDGQRFLNMSTAHRYYEYSLKQEQCARDLENLSSILFEEIDIWHKMYMKRMATDPYLLKDFPTRPSPQAMVLAIKAKSEIAERVLKTGQDMGIIEKRANEIRVSGNINLAAVPTGSLRVMLKDKLEQFKELVDKGELPPVYKQMIGRTIDGNSRPIREQTGRPECIDIDGEETS